MKIESYDERGYDTGGYIDLEIRMADGTMRNVQLFENDELAGGVEVRVLAEEHEA